MILDGEGLLAEHVWYFLLGGICSIAPRGGAD